MKTLAPLFLVSLLLIRSGFAAPAAQTGEQLLPETTVLCVELSQTKALLTAVMESPARQQFEGLDVYQALADSDQVKTLSLILGLLESKTGLKWRPTLETLTAGGVWVGIDAASEGGWAFLARSADEDMLEQVMDAVVEAARQDAEQKGNEPMRSVMYRGVEVYRVDKGGFTRVGPWLVVVNKSDLGRAIVDNLLDSSPASLSKNERFQAARKSYAGQGGWGWADLKTLREAGVAEKLFSGRANDPLGEALLGGLMEVLQSAPYATAVASLKGNHALDLMLSAPRGASSPEREFFFGADGSGEAEAALNVPGRLLALTLYRDLSAMWLAADALFEEAQAAKLAQQDSNLGTFFNGKNFGTDVLGQIRPQLQLLIAEQDYAGGVEPTLKLPAFALVGHLKDNGTLEQQLRAAFQTVMGFVNISGTQAGRPMMEMKTEERGEAKLVSARYVQEESPQRGDGGVHYNFSPALVQRGNWFAICTTLPLAEQIATRLGEPMPSAGVNSEVLLDTQALGRVLRANRQNFVAQQQLKKGLGEEEASRQVDAILSLVDLFNGLQLTLDSHETSFRLDLAVKFARSLAGE